MDSPFRSMDSNCAVDRLKRVALACLLAALPACSSDSKAGPPVVSSGTPDAAADGAPPSGVTLAEDGKPWATLAEWHLFEDAVKQTPADRVIPYDVIAPLFSDYTFKRRFVYVPEGAHIQYQATGFWNFPVGTVLVKTFSYLNDPADPSKGERLLETRLLVHQSDGWAPHTYEWNAEQTATTLERGGDVIDATFTDPSGASRTNGYVVPSESNCRQCHGKLGETNTLGGKTLQLDRDHDYGAGPVNQIDHLADLGLFDTPPAPPAEREHLVDPFDKANPVIERVRSYMDANCGQCHRPSGAPGSLSGLWIDFASTTPQAQSLHLGICKRPASAGHGTCGRPLDVIPGQPDESILLCRVESTLADTAMPPLGRRLVHVEGAALFREWIESLSGSCGGTVSTDAGPSPDSGRPEGGAVDSGARSSPTDAGPG